jgi:hypothetical protein
MWTCFGLMTGFFRHFNTERDHYTLQFTITHTHTVLSTVTSSLLLLGSSSQPLTFLFFGFLNCSRSPLPTSNSNSSHLHLSSLQSSIVEVEDTLQPTDSRPVRLPMTIFQMSFVRQLLPSSCRAPTLTRRLVCSLQCSHSLVRIAKDP